MQGCDLALFSYLTQHLNLNLKLQDKRNLLFVMYAEIRLLNEFSFLTLCHIYECEDVCFVAASSLVFDSTHIHKLKHEYYNQSSVWDLLMNICIAF
jgi:hypothetical protein